MSAAWIDVNHEMIIKAVKTHEEGARQGLLEDLLSATSAEYLRSIRVTRRDHQAGRVKPYKETFGR